MRVEVRCRRQPISPAQELTGAVPPPSENHAQVRCPVAHTGLEKLALFADFGLSAYRIYGIKAPGSGERTPDFPVVAKGVDDAPDSPSMLVGHRIDLFRSGFDRTCKDCVRIIHSQDDADSDTPE